MTFEEGCEKHLLYCKQRNLREGTLNHYRQSYLQFYKFFNPEMPLSEVDAEKYNAFVLYLCDSGMSDVSVNTYLRDLIIIFCICLWVFFLFVVCPIAFRIVQIETKSGNRNPKG